MDLIEKMELISDETADLSESLKAHLVEKKKLGKTPHYGDGSQWKEDGYGVFHCIKPGLPQGATATAIERKIITIRSHLNELRKLVHE